jgi:8-oxo-dGTP pyrophosphatase MutT (NUDIX family)
VTSTKPFAEREWPSSDYALSGGRPCRSRSSARTFRLPEVRKGAAGGFAEVPGGRCEGVELSAARREPSRRLTDAVDGFALVLAVAR